VTRGGVLLAVRDLLFRVRLETELRRLGVPSRTIGDAPLVEAVAQSAPGLVLLDLADERLDPLGGVRALRARPEVAGLPVVGFAPHADRALQQAAREAGCTRVVARSRIAAALPEVLAPFLRASGGG
jgi:CheY-like chemotaxis protein